MWSEIEQPSQQAQSQCQSWYSRVAARLLQDRLLLTALELHTELVEAGREEPQLREFFSNPANFERPPTDIIVRCPSQATLDSLDLTRLSEDSERSDDVAVLEFELRKAKETINALRANLTQVTECDSSSIDVGYEKILNEDSIKPHERRALNFLIYEYLLQQDCKLTSITFSDEVPEQDFECWDDVGLNVPRPAGLISMYRGETANQPTKSNCHQETQTDELALSESNSTYLLYPESKSAVESVNSFTDQNEEIVFLKKQILALETDKVNYQKLYDAALASLNSLTSPTSDVPSSETTLYNREDNSAELAANYASEIENIDDEMQPLPQNATQNYYGSSVSTNSLTPDQFEMIDSDKNGGSSQKDGSNVSSFEPAVMVEDHMVKSSHEPKRNVSETTLDDTSSFNDHIENDWEREQIIRTMKSLTDESFNAEGKNEAWINSDLPNEYKSILMKFCDIQYSSDNAFLKDIPHANQPISVQQFLNVVTAALPKIIPNILLVKRDEVIPLLICTIFLQPQQAQREKLLQLLLNLRKKMEKDDRALIISGLVLLLQWNIETNCGIDSDLLGFFWEMLNSKSLEKRILGAEASVALAPYISLELVNSLLLSMVLSMCDSGDVAIRKQGLSGAIMICPTANLSKYSQIESLFFTLVFDSDVGISQRCIETFAPVLARTALLNGIFHTEFCPHLLERLSDLIADAEQSVVVLKILNNTILFSLVYVIDVDAVKDRLSASTYNSRATQKIAEYLYDRPFHDLKYLSTDDSIDPFKLIQVFYEMTENDVECTWYERDWLIHNWLNKILYLLVTYRNPANVQTIHALIDFFNTWNVVFGDKFTKSFIRQMMESELNKIEQNIIKPEYRNQFSPILISIYLGTITCDNEDEENIRNAIKRWCICCGLCSISSTIIGVPLVIYSNKQPIVFNIALTAIWQCIVHSNEQVRAYVASLFDYLVQWGSPTEEVMNTSIIPGIVTLVSDSAIAVKCNAIKSLGSIVCQSNLYPTILDKSWHTLESLTIEEKTNGGLGSFTTICLAKTFHKVVKNDDPACQNRVLQNLATLCYSPMFNLGNVSAINGLLEELLSALQLATHKKICDQFVQTVLLPALRRLEGLDVLSWEYKCTVKSLIHKITSSEVQIKEHPSNSGQHQQQQQHGASIGGHTLPSLLANSESVGRRMTQMFQQSKPAMNLQNIFKKK